MTFDEYRRLDAVNWSTLKAMEASPAHYREALANGREDTPALGFGRLVDCLIFTPDEFGARYVVSPYDEFRSNEAKAWRVAQQARGFEVVKAEAVHEATELAKSVRAHPIARKFLDAGEFQVPLVWTDPETGLLCKGLTDLLGRKGSGFLVDGKSAATIDRRRYTTQIGTLRYHCQMAHYRAGCRVALGLDPVFIGHIVYEKGRPYDVGVFEFMPTVVDCGEVIVRELLNRVAECRASGVWPGRYPEIETVTTDDLPRWLDADEDESAEDLGFVTPP